MPEVSPDDPALRAANRVINGYSPLLTTLYIIVWQREAPRWVRESSGGLWPTNSSIFVDYVGFSYNFWFSPGCLFARPSAPVKPGAPDKTHERKGSTRAPFQRSNILGPRIPGYHVIPSPSRIRTAAEFQFFQQLARHLSTLFENRFA